MAGKRVLLVEDDAVIRGVVKQFVANAGWDVVEYDNGNAAAASLANERYDAAILDIQVPGMNGPTLLDRLRRERPDFPAVLMSGAATEASVQALMGRHVKLLGKPFTSQELDAALGYLVTGVERESLSVLVVDDHDGIRSMVESHLLSEGMKVESFANGTEALARISTREKPYDIALVDLHMPGMLGMEVIRAVGKMSPKTLPIMITGEADSKEVQEGYRNGAYGLLRKPFNLEELSAYFRKLDQARLERREEGAKKEALAKAPLPVQVAHNVKAAWETLPPAKRRETKHFFVVVLLAVAIGVPVAGLLYSAYEWATGGENKIVTFMDSVLGYLQRDEERDVKGQTANPPKPNTSTPDHDGH